MSRYEVRRAEALEWTTDPLTLEMLKRLPHMVSHPSPSGSEELCYQDEDIGGAICCSQSEVRLLNLLGSFHARKNCLEIGTYVGWSAAAFVLHHPNTSIYTIDNFSEAAGYLLSEPNMAMKDRFFQNMEQLGILDRIILHEGNSAEVIPLLSEARKVKWDLVFLDGWHLDDQPRKDVQAVLPYLLDDSVLIVHDTWMPDVFRVVRWLILNGWHCHTFPTANTLSVLYRREPKWWKRFLREV